MAAFSSVVALEQLLNQLSNSDQLPKEVLAPLLENITSLKSSLDKIFPAPKNQRKKGNKIANKIRIIIFEAQDQIESFIFTQSYPSESAETSKSQSSISTSLQAITEKLVPVTKKAEKLGDTIEKGTNYTKEVDESTTYKSSVAGKKTKIIGQEKYKAEIESKLLATAGSRLVIPICGMPGIGKTTLARSIYEDDNFMKNFPYKAWVTVSQDANVQEILTKILHSLESRGQKAGDKKYEGDEAKLRVELHQALSNNKYLVVVDDMWDKEVWMRHKNSLPDNENSSRVLLTTRDVNLVNHAKSAEGLVMQPLNAEDSWTLLRNRTFGDDVESPENLVELGRKIALHCKGLPLSLTVIGGLLSQGSREPEYWLSIEEDTYAATANSAIEDAYKEILSLSYNYLPSKLKGCFLYMELFQKIATSLCRSSSGCGLQKDFQRFHRPRSRPSSLRCQNLNF